MGLENRLYKWITEKKAPSWGYWLSFGDCSLWEQWYDFSRTRSHHMFGTVDEWSYKALAGLDVIDAKTLRIKPFICEELEWAKAHTNMPGGRASCYWRKENEELIIKVEIPFNTTATVYIPKMSGKTFYNSNEYIKLGSGNYEFRIGQ